MSTITKERVAEFIKNPLDNGLTRGEQMELARMALASLEAEAVTFRSKLKPPYAGSERWDYTDHRQPDAFELENCVIERLFTAQPAPVSVKIPPEKPHTDGPLSDGWNACRAAMLQGAEPVTTDYKLPDDFDFDRFNDVTWLEAVASNPHMHSPTTSTIAMVALELNKRLEACNSPVVPDGLVMVPVEPTDNQWAAGMQAFDSGMDKVTRVYKAMLAAAPRQEVKP